MGTCYIIMETRSVAVWVEGDSPREKINKFRSEHAEEIANRLDEYGEWEVYHHDFLRKEDCDFVI